MPPIVVHSSRALAALFVITSTCLIAAGDPSALQVQPLDTAAIAKAVGKAGQMAGDVYRIALPRTDLDVKIEGVRLKPAFALGGWAAFHAERAGAVADGDLVLLESEVNPVVSALQEGGLDITAIHNHLLHETPHVMYVHFWGRGAALSIARALGSALALTGTPLTAAAPAAPQPPGFDAEAIQRTLGARGTLNGVVLSIGIPRREPISMMGVAMPAAMGMATSLNFQAAGGGRVAATGDFVLLGDEVNPVIHALRAHAIEVTALHNHMIDGSPELYFLHFWAEGPGDGVAAGLKSALDAAGARHPAMQPAGSAARAQSSDAWCAPRAATPAPAATPHVVRRAGL